MQRQFKCENHGECRDDNVWATRSFCKALLVDLGCCCLLYWYCSSQYCSS